MRVRDLLRQKAPTLITVQPNDDLSTAVQLFIIHNIGGLPVLAPDGAVVGLLAERDVVRALHEQRESIGRLRVRDAMRPAPMCEADDSLNDTMRRMTSQRHRHLLVRDHGTAIGVISLGDLVKHRLEELETETGVLRDYVAAQRASH